MRPPIGSMAHRELVAFNAYLSVLTKLEGDSTKFREGNPGRD